MSTRNQWLVTAAGLVLALLATTPAGWAQNAGRWYVVARTASGPILVLGLVGVILALAYRVQRGPYPRGRMPLARTFFDNAGVIRTVHRRDHRGERHRVRVVVATGQTMQGLLRWVIDHVDAQAHWEIQILLMSPDSPFIDAASRHWRRESRANLEALADLRTAAARKHGSISIEWRTFLAPPKIRALAFDDDELFIGFYVWDYHRPDAQMRHQDREHLHFRRGHAGFDYFWEFFEGWFAWEWQQGRTLDLGDTELGDTEPGDTEPGDTEPGDTEPGDTEPGDTEPGTSDPGTSDPGTSDPGTSDPGTSEPPPDVSGPAGEPRTGRAGQASPGSPSARS